jgi:NAD(P)-dependent dehydrogenase (short-subunit alcohol dehydrogenase family)
VNPPPNAPLQPFADLHGKVALVTGAFSGLGRHFALTLARAGCRVALAGRRVAEGAQLQQTLQHMGVTSCVVRLDVRDPDSVSAALDEVRHQLGTIDILVNNAGVAITRPAVAHTEADWQTVIDTNLNGVFRVAQAAARQMMAADKGGSIVNIASVAGLRVMQQVPSYHASKAGVIHMSKALALEWARHGIRVNALAPGYIATAINQDHFASDKGQAMLQRVPQRRIGLPEELEAPLLLLASSASSYMTGSVLVVDGGHTVNTL